MQAYGVNVRSKCLRVSKQLVSEKWAVPLDWSQRRILDCRIPWNQSILSYQLRIIWCQSASHVSTKTNDEYFSPHGLPGWNCSDSAQKETDANRSRSLRSHDLPKRAAFWNMSLLARAAVHVLSTIQGRFFDRILSKHNCNFSQGAGGFFFGLVMCFVTAYGERDSSSPTFAAFAAAISFHRRLWELRCFLGSCWVQAEDLQPAVQLPQERFSFSFLFPCDGVESRLWLWKCFISFCIYYSCAMDVHSRAVQSGIL